MFSMRNFVRRGFLAAVGKQPDFWIILNAAGWADKGILVSADLEEIQAAIDAQYTVHEEDAGETVEE